MCQRLGHRIVIGSAPKAPHRDLPRQRLVWAHFQARVVKIPGRPNFIKSCSLRAEVAGCLSKVRCHVFLTYVILILFRMQRQLKIDNLPACLAAMWPFDTFLANEWARQNLMKYLGGSVPMSAIYFEMPQKSTL